MGVLRRPRRIRQGRDSSLMAWEGAPIEGAAVARFPMLCRRAVARLAGRHFLRRHRAKLTKSYFFKFL